jgi:copper chaperone
MITFEVNDMTCGHCVSTISKAVASIDNGANIQVDLAAHRVQIQPTTATAQQLSDAIKDAGYSPVVTDGTSPIPAATKRSGCCCG